MLFNLIVKYPQVFLFIHKIRCFLTIPLRLVKRSSFVDQYYASLREFAVGDHVRFKKYDGPPVKIMLSPHVQKQLDIPESNRNNDDPIEWDISPPSVGTIAYSLYVAKDTWVVDGFETPTLERWLYYKIILDTCNESPGELIIRPLDETRIAWPGNERYGKNKTAIQRELIEKVPKLDHQ